MANTVDERIVEARFDSSQFEKGVKQTIDKLDELKDALNLKNAGKTIAEVSKDTSSSLEKVGNTLDKLTQRLTTFKGMIKQQILGGLAQEVSNAVLSIERSITGFVKSIGSDQISAGMSKYNEILTSVRTMTAAGIDQEAAYGAITRLQYYSDQTSYSLSQMTSGMSKLVAAGVDLKRAEKAMEGLSNMCASAGVNIYDANRAFYNFSQAISTGSMQVRDWVSFENLNMATEGVKKIFMEAAVESGTLTKTIGKDGQEIYKTSNKVNKKVKANKDVTATNLRDTLSSGWLDKETMIYATATLSYFEDLGMSIEDLNKLSGDALKDFAQKAYQAAKEAKSFNDVLGTIKDAVATGWSTTFELIFGKLDKATEFFTWLTESNLAEVIYSIGDFRNQVLTAWGKDFGEGGLTTSGKNGREQLLAALHNIDDMIGSIHEGLGTLGVVEWNGALARYLSFPEVLGKKLVILSRKFRLFTTKAKAQVQEFVDKFVDLYTEEKYVNGVTQRVLKPEYVERLDKIKKGISSVFAIIKKVSGIMLSTFNKAFFKIQPILDAVGDAIGKFLQPITDLSKNTKFFANISHAVDNLLTVIEPFIPVASSFISFLGDVAAFFLEGSINALSLNIELFADALGLIIELFGGTSSQKAKEGVGVIEGWKKKVKEFGDTCKEAFGTIKEFFTALFDDIRKLFGINNEANQNGNIFENVAKFFETNKFLKKVRAWINQAIKDIGAWILDIPNKISKFFVNVGDFFHGLFYTKDDAGNEIETPLKKWLNQAAINMKKWFKSLPDKLMKALASVGDFASKLWNSIDELIFGKKTTKLKYNKDTKKFEPYTVRVKEGLSLWLDNLWTSVKNWVKTIPDKFNKIWSAIMDFLFGKEQVKTVTDPTTGETKQITERVKEGFSKWLDNTVKSIKDYILSLPGKIVELWNTVIGWIFGSDDDSINPPSSGGEGDSKSQKVNKGIISWLKETVDWLSNNLFDTVWQSAVKIWEGVMRSIFGAHVVEIPDDADSAGQTDAVALGFEGWLNNVLSYITGPFFGTLINIANEVWNALISLIFGDSVSVEDPDNTGAAEDDNKVVSVKTGISEWLTNLVETVKGFFSDLFETIKLIWNNVINAIFGTNVDTSEPTDTDASESDSKVSTVGTGIRTWLKNLADNVSALLVGAIDFIKELWQGVIDGLFGTSVGSIEPANTAASDSDTKTSSVKDGIKKWISNIRFKAASFVSNAVDFIKKLWSAIINGIFGWDEDIDESSKTVNSKRESDISSGIIDWVKGLAVKVGEWIGMVPGAIKNIWNTILGAIFGTGSSEDPKDKASVEDAVTQKATAWFRPSTDEIIKSSAQSFIERVGEDIGKIISELPSEIVKGIHFAVGLGEDLLTAMTGALQKANIAKKAGEEVGKISDAIAEETGEVNPFFAAISDLGQSIWDVITKTVPSFISSAWEYVSLNSKEWWASLTGAFDMPGKNWSEIAEKIAGIGTGIAEKIESLPDTIGAAADTVKKLLASPDTSQFDYSGFNKAWEYAEKQIIDSSVGLSEKEVSDKLDKAKRELKKAFGIYDYGFGDMAKAIGESFKEAFIEVGPYIIDGLNTALGWIESGFNTASDFLSKRDKTKPLSESFEEAMANGVDGEKNTRLAQSISSLGSRIKSLIVDTIPRFTTEAVEELKVQIPKILTSLFDIDLFGGGSGGEAYEEASKAAEEQYEMVQAGVLDSFSAGNEEYAKIQEQLGFNTDGAEEAVTKQITFFDVMDKLSDVSNSSFAKFAGIALILHEIANIIDSFSVIEQLGDVLKWGAINTLVKGIIGFITYLLILSATGNTEQYNKAEKILDKCISFVQYLAQAIEIIMGFYATAQMFKAIKGIGETAKGAGGFVKGATAGLGAMAAISIGADILGESLSGFTEDMAEAFTYIGVGLDQIIASVDDLAAIPGKVSRAKEGIQGIGEILGELRSLFITERDIQIAVEEVVYDEYGDDRGLGTPQTKTFTVHQALLAEDFNTIAYALTKLSGSIANFRNAVTTNALNGDNTTGVTDALTFVLNLTDDMASFVEFTENDDTFEKFKNAIMSLGAAMQFYSLGNISFLKGGVDSEVISNAADLLGQIFGNDKLRELIHKVSAEQNIGDTDELIRNAEAIAIFAGALVTIANACEGITDETSGSITKLIELINGIDAKVNANTDDGVSSITELSQRFGEVGNAIGAFAYNIQGLNESDFKLAKEAIETLTKMAIDLGGTPNTGLFARLIEGDKSVVNFGVNVSGFGKHLAEFFNSIKGSSYSFDKNVTNQLALMINKILELSRFLGTVKNDITGKYGVDLAEGFGDLGKFGQSIADFVKNICSVNVPNNNIDFDFVKSAIGELNNIISLFYNMSGIGYIVSRPQKSYDEMLEDVSSIVNGSWLGTGGTYFDEQVSDTDTVMSNIQMCVENLGSISSLILGDGSSKGLLDYLSEFYEKINSTATSKGITQDMMYVNDGIIKSYFRILGLINEIPSIESKSFDLSLLEELNSNFDVIDEFFSNVTGSVDKYTKTQIDKFTTFTMFFNAFSTFGDSLTRLQRALTEISGFDDLEARYSKKGNLKLGLDVLDAIDWQELSDVKQKIDEVFGKSFYSSTKDIGAELNRGFTDGLNAESIKEQIAGIGETIKSELTESLSTSATDLSIWGTAYLVGEKISDGIVAGINLLYGEGVHEKPYDVVKAITDSITTLLTEINPDTSNSKFYDTGYSAGYNLDAGLAEGINSGKAVAAAQMLAKLISGSFTVSWEMHSPSRLFQSFGQYLDLGLMKGIEENGDRPVDAATAIAEDSVDGVQSILKTIQDLVLEDMDVTPTITPVVDMSNVTEAAQQIQALGFNGSPFTFDVSGMNYNVQAANPDYNREVKVDTDYSGIISSIRSEIAALAGTMSGVSGSLSGMRVVLDSGAIVGGIINDVDSALGRRGFYAGREG